jgi:hypothetical protein
VNIRRACLLRGKADICPWGHRVRPQQPIDTHIYLSMDENHLRAASLWLAHLLLFTWCSQVLSAANVSNSIGSGQWWLIRPPTSYYQPDVDTMQTTPFPRIPPSPYGTPALICPQADGVPYSVGGYPGTPYTITPFSDLFYQPPELASVGTVCRTGDTNPQHCMKAYEMTATAFQSRVFDNAIPACKAFPGTWLMGYNGITPGPTIHHPV